MDRQIQLSPEQFIKQLHGEFEQAMAKVAEAVNQAPDGQWINAGEVQVRDIMTEFQRTVYQKALQMRVDAAEAAFSPGGPGNAQTQAKQGTRRAIDLEHQRMGVSTAAALSQQRRGDQHAQR